MSEHQNMLLVQEFYAAFKRGDITGVLNTLADDVSWLIPGPTYSSDWVPHSQFTMAKSRTLRSVWTPMHGQPHIAVLNPLPPVN